MKLRNKKTGEIREGEDVIIENLQKNGSTLNAINLDEIKEEWEDYEEPKGIQCIYCVNHFDAAKLDGVIVGFETKEEAKKAVEKLKAWKRLKDKGFEFEGGDDACISYKTDIENWSTQDLQDFETLFGGENE